MKLSRTFDIEVDGTVFTFEKPKGNESLNGLDGRQLLDYLFSKLKAIKGEAIQDENGDVVTPEGLRSLDLPTDALVKIKEKYLTVYVEMLGGVSGADPEKKSEKSV